MNLPPFFKKKRKSPSNFHENTFKYLSIDNSPQNVHQGRSNKTIKVTQTIRKTEKTPLL